MKFFLFVLLVGFLLPINGNAEFNYSNSPCRYTIGLGHPGSVQNNGYVQQAYQDWEVTSTGTIQYGALVSVPKYTNYYRFPLKVVYYKGPSGWGVSTDMGDTNFVTPGSVDLNFSYQQYMYYHQHMPICDVPFCWEDKQPYEDSCEFGVDYSNWDDATCTGEIKCVEPCQEQYSQYEQICGGSEYVSIIDFDTCEMACTQCEDVTPDYSVCAANSGTMHPTTCEIDCYSCEDAENDARAYCASRGGIQKFQCYIDDITTPKIYEVVIKCYDDITIYPPPDPNPDPGTPPPPTPEPGPTDPPPDNEDLSSWLKSIKGDTGKIVTGQGKGNELLSAINKNAIDQSKKLDDIAGNTADTVRGLKDVENAINDLELDTGGIEDGLGDVKGAIEGIGDDIVGAIDGTSTDLEMPETPEFSTDIGEYSTIDLNNRNDPEQEALLELDKRQDRFDQLSTPYENRNFVDEFVGDINLQTEACITGSMYGKQFSICFNEPWMHTGYNIVKAVLIFCGYIQGFFMITRAVTGA